MKLLHTADWQIGKPFAGFDPDDAVLLTAARIDTVKAIAKLAAEHDVDVVLVAGDVFDAQTVSDKTIQQTFNALSGYSGTWLFLPGNHDAALAESVWSRAQRLGAVPANAILCLTQQPVDIHDGAAVILPAPLTQRNTFEDLTEWFSSHQTAPHVLRIGLAHGSVQGILPDNIDSPNPIAPNRAAEANLDYLALGDWHGLRKVDDRTWYSGTPETDRFSSNDPGHVLVVDVTPGELPQVHPIQIGQHDWQTLDVRLTVSSDIDMLEQTLERLPNGGVAEISIAGTLDLVGQERVMALLSKAQGRAKAMRWDSSGLHILPSQDDIDTLRADGYLAEVIEQLRTDQTTSNDPGLARDALVLLATTMRGIARVDVPA